MGMTRCPQCRNEVPVADVRYTSPAEYACKDCAAPAAQRSVPDSSKAFDVSPDPKKVLVCENCGFENKVSKDAQDVSCGYCGSADVRPDGTRAAELLAEVDDVSTTE